MNIQFNVRSSNFLLPCKAAIRKNKQRLQHGNSISLNLAAGGYGGQVYVRINPHNPSSFSTNWTNIDPTRFPARIKAAATTLRDAGYAGRFEIMHDDGLLKMRQI